MPADNKNLASLLENLIASHENEINYTPVEIELDPQSVKKEDIATLLQFVQEKRKRLFIFRLANDEFNSNLLALTARRSLLKYTAETLLNTTSEPKINPLKEALNSSSSTIRANIQIQKSIHLPKHTGAVSRPKSELVEQIKTEIQTVVPAKFPELPALEQQLSALGIENVEETAAQIIKEHLHAFTDGIIPGNLIQGFYIDKNVLCFTHTPRRLPSALAPALHKPALLALPTVEQARQLLPEVTETLFKQLLNNSDHAIQKQALITAIPAQARDISNLLSSIQQAEVEFIVPVLAKLFVLGGEAHTKLFIKILNNCLSKGISIEFLKDPVAQDAFLNPRGIKNLQKLLQLPKEQREWWNKLAIGHLKNPHHHFDFNNFFEAYTQIFLPRITEKNLLLPYPCPIEHNGHLLITLNRVLDVIERAQNPQEQCASLHGLNWGPTGAHYAMTQAPKPQRFKQVAACMQLKDAQDVEVDPEKILAHLSGNSEDLKLWLFRYMGPHWKETVRLTDIRARFAEIENLDASWTALQKNQFMFILTCTFSQEENLVAEHWQKTLKNCSNLLQPFSETERNNVLEALVHCFRFKPNPSLLQIQTLLSQIAELKVLFPEKNFNNEIIIPLVSCLENEGLELINRLKDRIEKTTEEANRNTAFLTAIASFTTLLQKNRENLAPDIISLLAALNEPDLTQDSIEMLENSINVLKTKKDITYCNALINLLGQINISKSQPLPNGEQIRTFIDTLANSNSIIPAEQDTLDKQEKWLNNYIIEQNLLPGCVFGKGDISKLDDLIVDALTDAVKKRSSVLRVDSLKNALLEHLKSPIIPKALKDQLDGGLLPFLDALTDLINLLQTPNPKFTDIIDKFSYFEEKKPNLLNSTYSVSILGQSKGEYILSFILTGKRKSTDNLTGAVFAKALSTLHNTIAGEIHSFFNDDKNKNIVADLDAQTCLNWFARFNDTHSLTFLFKEELVQKKVLPALKKTLQQLNTQDSEFENSILETAATLAEDQPSDQSLQNYKATIETIVSYLNFLIDVKDKASEQFYTIYKKLQTSPLTRLNYSQKQTLVNTLLKAEPNLFGLYLRTAIQALEENPAADTAAIDRALNGLETLFELTNLEADTRTLFFKMSMGHNLKSPSPFPLATLNELTKSNLEEETKSLILRQIIQILSRMTENDSQDLVQGLIVHTQSFLTKNPTHASLCISLLKRISLDNLSRDLSSYSNILNQLALLKEENRESLIVILEGLASSKKDDTVNLPTLLDIANGLGRRSASDIREVMQLFATPPYPIAQTLNAALVTHGSEKLRAYCLSFDTNPFAKTGETRPLAEHFATDRVEDALLSLQDLLHGVDLPPALKLQLASQLNYIETLGYTDPLNPYDYSQPKKLTASSRQQLQERASTLLNQLRLKEVPDENIAIVQMELLAYLREIYFRTTGLFPNTTQMLMLLLSLQSPYANLLMRINTGEGKSLITPILAVLQWTQGGTVDTCTANGTLLLRDYENSCEPFFKFLGIKSALIHANSQPKEYRLGGINCSTLEDMALFRLAAKETQQEAFTQNGEPIHLVLDECDDALLDQTTLYKLVAENTQYEAKDIHAQWIYQLAYQFIHLPTFRNTDPARGKVWDEEEDVEQFRLFINKEIIEKFNGDAEKQNFMLATSNAQLKQWINASCKAEKLIEDRHFLIRPIKEKDETGNEITKRFVCIPLVRSNPKGGCIFTDGVQQAMQARLIAEHPDKARYVVIDGDPFVLASQSARGLVGFYQETGGRLVGISGTPGDPIELLYLATQLGTQAISVAPYAGDHRKKHPPIFTFSRDETLRAMHKAIDGIKRPVKKPRLEFDSDIPIQTLEEREAFILQTKDALDKWSQTQTQPILIVCDDFNEAQTIGKSFDAYRREGFKIQIVTGKESPEELDRIIKQAGKANTITIGTAMLARGIDINPGNHPEGLFVIQTCKDSKRRTTQIAGRAARNGKPGQWLPVYELPAPKSWFTKLMYFLFPSIRQLRGEQAIEKFQEDIQLQDTLDRLYTQGVDRAQQILMQQVSAWESCLLELYPTDPNLKHELYQWRQLLISELTNAQETSLKEDTVEASIAHFQNSLCKIWENVKEEKWVAKAQHAETITAKQQLRLTYLKQLDLAKELQIQRALQEKSLPFKESATGLMQQNLQAVIVDKAGAVLEYTKPTDTEKKDLELAQSKQLLPHLIGELCAVYPEAVSKLNATNKAHSPSIFPAFLVSLAEKVIKQKNKVLRIEDTKQITQSTIEFFQKKLNQADAPVIQELLKKIKPLLLAHSHSLASMPLIDKFKTQGLILTFTKLYNQAVLEPDEHLEALKTQYSDDIMKMLAEHLINEFDWVKRSPQPWHARLEWDIAKEAAETIYSLAQNVHRTPRDPNTIQALYIALQQQRTKLQDKYLFSLRHRNPNEVVNTALTAIESLVFAPHCDREFQKNHHDAVLSAYHLGRFNTCLTDLSKQFEGDTVWELLKTTLDATNRGGNQVHLIEELYETVERFRSYPDYKPYRIALGTLRRQLAYSIKALNKTNGIKQDTQDSLLTHKASEFAALFHVKAEHVRIQSGHDGTQSFIEVQIEGSDLHEGFSGYQPTPLTRLEKERAQLYEDREKFNANKEALINLTDRKIVEILPVAKRPEFDKLFQLKELLNTSWSNNLNNPIFSDLPAQSQEILGCIQQLKNWDGDTSLQLVKTESILGKKSPELFDNQLEKHLHLKQELEQILKRKNSTQVLRDQKEEDIKKELENQKKINDQLTDAGFGETISLSFQAGRIKLQIFNLQKQLFELERDFKTIVQEETLQLRALRQSSLVCQSQANTVITSLEEKAKDSLRSYLQKTSAALVTAYDQELDQIDATIKQINDLENKKSRYQTRRFANSRELLRYEASLKQEEASIPKNASAETEQQTALTRFFWQTVEKTSTQLEELVLRLR
ncbi:helicase-related protein [Legionella hackeliae]|uniref:Putative coiled-coil protein n=1 Tax=Legionella hackeliae TaxID=449 RepID=A0A0A8UNE8_LEGHA|nr:helicase-related protein [Legionella hackeliae]KTD14191.1 coiled-coil protein [Legionella hackeliae]CEK10400.1 putative coiled-coil protein [Legionella hackeliae]STX47136.1 coiled-coil protein [Legionella hackeliae]